MLLIFLCMLLVFPIALALMIALLVVLAYRGRTKQRQALTRFFHSSF